MSDLSFHGASAIPGDERFVLRRSPGGWVGSSVLGAGLVLLGNVIIFLGQVFSGKSVSLPVSLFLVLLILAWSAWVVVYWRRIGATPMLAAGTDGVWVRNKAREPRVIFIPWVQIGSIVLVDGPSRPLPGRERMIVVRAHSPAPADGGAADRPNSRGFATFEISTYRTNCKPEQTLSALAVLASGRTRVGEGQ